MCLEKPTIASRPEEAPICKNSEIESQSKEFEKKDFFKNSIKLRKFDEVAKKTDVKMKSIIEYKDLLSSQLI